MPSECAPTTQEEKEEEKEGEEEEVFVPAMGEVKIASDSEENELVEVDGSQQAVLISAFWTEFGSIDTSFVDFGKRPLAGHEAASEHSFGRAFRGRHCGDASGRKAEQRKPDGVSERLAGGCVQVFDGRQFGLQYSAARETSDSPTHCGSLVTFS